jgi:KipI family sensor histidine kinase inhibitor
VSEVRRCGDLALLVEVDDPAGVARTLREAPPAGVVEVVPAAATVLVVHTAGTDVRRLAAVLADVAPTAARDDDREVEIPVRYDGDDLADVAAACGTTVDDVVRRHAAASYTVAFCGFAPGFAYLRGLDPSLVVPRLATPRVRVPAGSVAIADTWSAVYPRESPGGWRLLGRTDAALWDLGRPAPALLSPGTRVRFVDAGR